MLKPCVSFTNIYLFKTTSMQLLIQRFTKVLAQKAFIKLTIYRSIPYTMEAGKALFQNKIQTLLPRTHQRRLFTARYCTATALTAMTELLQCYGDRQDLHP